MNDDIKQPATYNPMPLRAPTGGTNYQALPNTVTTSSGTSIAKKDVYQAAAQNHDADWHNSPVGVDTYSASVRTQQGLMDKNASPQALPQVSTRLGMGDSQVYNPTNLSTPGTLSGGGHAMGMKLPAQQKEGLSDTQPSGISPLLQQVLQTL